MRWSVRVGIMTMAAASVALAGCGSSGGGESSDGGGEASSGDCVVTLDQVKDEFPDEGINAEKPTSVEGSSDACEFTGDVKAGVMGKYTGPTTVTFVVGTYDDEADGEAAFTEVSEEIGSDTQSIEGFQVAAGSQKAVAKYSDGTYAFATIDSPELSGPGNEQTVAMLELVAANQ